MIRRRPSPPGSGIPSRKRHCAGRGSMLYRRQAPVEARSLRENAPPAMARGARHLKQSRFRKDQMMYGRHTKKQKAVKILISLEEAECEQHAHPDFHIRSLRCRVSFLPLSSCAQVFKPWWSVRRRRERNPRLGRKTHAEPRQRWQEHLGQMAKTENCTWLLRVMSIQ